MEKALIKELNTYYNGYNETFGGEGFVGLKGEDNPLSKPKEYYLINSVEKSNFLKSCIKKSWNYCDFIEIKDYTTESKYFYIYKYSSNIKNNYEYIKSHIKNIDITNFILELDSSIELDDLAQEVWIVCYNIPTYNSIATSILFNIWNKCLNEEENKIILEDINIDRDKNYHVGEYISSWFFNLNTK